MMVIEGPLGLPDGQEVGALEGGNPATGVSWPAQLAYRPRSSSGLNQLVVVASEMLEVCRHDIQGERQMFAIAKGVVASGRPDCRPGRRTSPGTDGTNGRLRGRAQLRLFLVVSLVKRRLRSLSS